MEVGDNQPDLKERNLRLDTKCSVRNLETMFAGIWKQY